MSVERVPIGEVRPSQLYVDAGRLHDALSWFDPDDPSYDPIPVVDLAAHVPENPAAFDAHVDVDPDGIDRPVALDGHTRCLLAHLAGEDELRVERVTDLDPGLDLDLHAQCVGWCRAAGLSHVSDLAGRVVSTETFEAAWIRRCHESPLYTPEDDGHD